MRRGRPRGLTIALLACAVLYGLYPLAQASLFMVAAVRTSNPISARMVLGVVLGVGFLLLMIPAWLGRPPQMRLILTLVVLGLMVLNLAFVISDLSHHERDIIADAGSQISRAINICSLVFQILVPLYVIWYLNRYPSRAYFSRQQG